MSERAKEKNVRYTHTNTHSQSLFYTFDEIHDVMNATTTQNAAPYMSFGLEYEYGILLLKHVLFHCRSAANPPFCDIFA